MLDEKRILAIDYGLKRIGLALSDPLMIFAYPFETITNDHNLWNRLSLLVKEKNIIKVILGFPFTEAESSTSIKNDLNKFKTDLEKQLNIEVIFRDESYTSEMAKDIVVKSVTKKSKRREKGILDKNAAAIILQEYLDEINQKKKS